MDEIIEIRKFALDKVISLCAQYDDRITCLNVDTILIVAEKIAKFYVGSEPAKDE